MMMMKHSQNRLPITMVRWETTKTSQVSYLLPNYQTQYWSHVIEFNSTKILNLMLSSKSLLIIMIDKTMFVVLSDGYWLAILIEIALSEKF